VGDCILTEHGGGKKSAESEARALRSKEFKDKAKATAGANGVNTGRDSRDVEESYSPD
jgi:hypothetical protein